MKFLWISVAVMLVGFSARAETLGVLDLRLHPGPAWQRGASAQEQEDDALLLSWPVPEGVALQVVVPRNPPLIKSDADTFYRHLTREWTLQYGKEAAVGWIDFGGGGPRWLSCRRPARSGEGVVFHLTTVHEGRAYSLLLFAPPKTESLPQAVHALVAGAGFHAPPTVWRHTLGLAMLPQAEALEALAQAEADVLGDQGMLTGYGVNTEKSGKPGGDGGVSGEARRLNWFLDGFRWAKGYGRDERQPFEARGQLMAEAPPEWTGGALRMELNVGASETALAARASFHAYCGPRGPWDEAMAALARGARGPLGRLARDHACAGRTGDGVLASLEARTGQTLVRSVPLAAPPDKADRLWLEVRLLPEAGSPGEGLLDRLGLYFVYEPER